jgi:HK97 family phage portal protein
LGLIETLRGKLVGRGDTNRLVSPDGVAVGGRVAFPNRGGYIKNVKEAYEKNAIVAACVGLMSSTMNEPPLGVIEQDGTVNLNHPLAIMFRRPNPYMGQADFWRAMWLYLYIKGNAYIRKIRNDDGAPIGYLVYSDAHVVPVLDAKGWVYGYRYQSDGIDEIWMLNDVIHIRNPLYADPLRLYMGMSPIDVAWNKIATYNELQSTVYSMMASNGVVSGVFAAPGQVDAMQVSQLKEQVRKRRDASGKERTDPLVLGNGMTYTRMGLDASSMQAKEMAIELEAAICAAFRIHPTIIGSAAGITFSTYNNLQAAYAEFTTLLRVPLWSAVEEQLEAGLSHEYPGIQLAFDLSQVQSLQPDVDKVIYPVISTYNANIVTQNEARGKLGYDPVDDGDAYAYERVADVSTGVSMAMGAATPLGANTEPLEGSQKIVESTDGERIKWYEPEAVKYWQAMDTAVEDAARQFQEPAKAMILRAERMAMRKIKSEAAEAIDIETLVAQFMTATEETREALLRKVIDLTITGTGVDLNTVQSFIDDVRDAQTRETQSNLSRSCETLRKEVTRITETYAGDVDAMREALRGRFAVISESRAATIARTTARAQSTVVQNETTDGLNKREREPSRKFVMVWLSRRDADVRDTHEALDGKTVKPVAAGGFESWEKHQAGITKGPGVGTDPAQIINCRCVQRPTRANDTQGTRQ